MFFENVENAKIVAFWSNMIQNVVFLLQFFLKMPTRFFKFFSFDFDTFYFLIRKSDASWNYFCKINLFKVIQDRSNRSILLSNVIQNNIFRKQTFFEFRQKTLMHWTFFLIHAFRKSKENAKKMSFSRSNMIHEVTFWMQTFLNFWHVFKSLIRNLTRYIIFLNRMHCEVLNIKSCFLKEQEKGKNVVSRSNIFKYAFFEI